jgi:hypothetical protein
MVFILRGPLFLENFAMNWTSAYFSDLLCHTTREIRVERTFLTRILGELYELPEFLLGINIEVVIFHCEM